MDHLDNSSYIRIMILSHYHRVAVAEVCAPLTVVLVVCVRFYYRCSACDWPNESPVASRDLAVTSSLVVDQWTSSLRCFAASNDVIIAVYDNVRSTDARAVVAEVVISTCNHGRILLETYLYSTPVCRCIT